MIHFGIERKIELFVVASLEIHYLLLLNRSYSNFGGDTDNAESILEDEEELKFPEDEQDDRCLQSFYVMM